MATLSVKLVIDKEKNRVVFAESDKDFVDILFSFLTLPMGTIVRLLGKKSGVGCMDNLYESVENLDMKYLQTKACRMMLLQPRGASEKLCEGLVINVDDLKPRRLYRCPKFDCLTKTHCLFSNVPDAQCPCGDVMNKGMEWLKREVNKTSGGIFVKGKDSFIITDDLNIMPISTSATLSLLQRFGITDADALENKTVEISKEEVLSVLKSTLISETPLTDVFLRKPEKPMDHLGASEELKLNDAHLIKAESTECSTSKTVCFKLLESKSLKKVVYAEAGQELADVLFSFLTFPLGSIVKLLNKNSALGCADNLYRSAEVLSLIDNIKSTERKEMLLVPKLGTHFGCTNQILKIDEKLSALKSLTTGCDTCSFKGKCSHGVEDASITKTNPKMPTPGTDHGGGFADGSMFMVTNDMTITPFSPTIGLNQVKELKVSITSLVERSISCGEAEVLSLLKACLISRSVLNKVFAPNSGKKQPKIESV